MNSLPAPEGWLDGSEDFEKVDEKFNSGCLYDLPKPYKTLLVHDFHSTDYIIACGTPGSENPKECCYVFFNLETNTVARIVSPTKLDQLWTALEYWDPDTAGHAKMGVKYERLLFLESTSVNEHSDKRVKSSMMVIPPAPYGWTGHPKYVDFLDHVFDTDGLCALPKPFKTLLVNDDRDIYIIQCGMPHSKDPNKFCYIKYFTNTNRASRIVSPSNIEEIWTALSYRGTNEYKDQGVKTESIPMVAAVVRGET